MAKSTGDVQWLAPAEKRPKIALVLSGGGARGLAHIGVLQAWEEVGLPIDLIVGTSIGGTMGGLYSAGYSADSLASLTRAANWNRILSSSPSRGSLFLSRRRENEQYIVELRFNGLRPKFPTALSSGQQLSDFLNTLTRAENYRIGGDFDRLRIPLRVVATDLVSGERVVIGSGNLGDALRSTVAIPLAFTPWETDGRLLADGGLVDPIPVDVAREQKADWIVAVNATSPLLPREDLTDPLTLANQATTVMVMQRQKEQLGNADFVITPDLSGLSNSSFQKVGELIERGHEAALPVLRNVKDAMEQKSAHPANGTSPPSADTLSPEYIQWRLDRLVAGGRAVRASARLVGAGDSARVVWDIDTLPALKYVQLAGNTLIPTDSLLGAIYPLIGTGPSGDTLAAALATIEQLYEASGYPLVSLAKVLLTQDGLLVLGVDEAPVGEVVITGNKRTRTSVIRRSLPELIGRPINEKELETGVSTVYATGFFHSVTATAVEVDSLPQIEFRVTEQDFVRLRLGLHWDEEFHAETKVELADINTLGYGHKTALTTLFGDRRKFYRLSVGADRLSSTYLTYQVALYHQRDTWRRYRGSELLPTTWRFNRTGGRISLGQQIRHFGEFSVGVRAEHVDEILEPGVSDQNIEVRTLWAEAQLDTYDRFPFPRKGYRQRLTFERAERGLGGSAQYTRFYGELDGVIPLGYEHAILFGIQTGTADTRLPESERFLMGGRYSFLGWRVAEGRGDHFWIGDLGLRFRLPGRRFLTFRYNLGNIWSNGDKIDLLDVDHGAGVAFAIDSPFGPLEVAGGVAERRQINGYVHLGLPF